MNGLNLKWLVPGSSSASLQVLKNPGTWIFLFFALAVLPINQGVPSEDQLVIFVMLYFALAWTAYFYAIVARRSSNLWLGLSTAIFAVVVGIPFGRALKYTIFAPFYHISSSPNDIVRLIGTVGSHGMAEESLKFLPVVLLAFVFKQVRKPIDGMFYGALAGLGFAAWEGYKYVIDPKYGAVLIQTLIRSTALPFLHAAYTAIGCYFVALATRETTTKDKLKLCVLGYFISATLHGVYDFLSDTPKNMTAVLIYLLFTVYAAQSHQLVEQWERESAAATEPQLPEAEAASAVAS
jgi:RsiW-degrading membrane proteinase PrsW (M82 family)